MALNAYHDANLPVRQLAKLAALLGSDVPFFLNGPLASCTGRGEKVRKIPRKFEFAALLVLPAVSVATSKVYANYRHDNDGYRRLHTQIAAFMRENRIDLLSGMCANMLTESCFELHKELAELKKEIDSLGVAPLCLSGSGSAMYCIITEKNRQAVTEHQHKLHNDFRCRTLIVKNNLW
jgi:4-diphosphocytidyl-2-C-methyl-D-erythritol kinase